MLEITVDPRSLISSMNGMEAQLPFATARALNEVAVAFQMDEQQVIQGEFTVRRPWVLKGVKIDRKDFATKSKLEVRIHIDPTRDFLNKFEQGGTKTPRSGISISIPIGARRSLQSIIPSKLRPKNLHFKPGKHGTLVGDDGTFLIRKPNGAGVILQRKGRAVSLKKRLQGPLMKGQRRDNNLVVLYVLKPKAPVPAELHFHDTARKTFTREWPRAFTKWWNESVRTARTGKPIAQGMSLPAGWTE